MRLPVTQARAYVFGPPELAALLTSQFNDLGIRAEAAVTPATDEELYSWLKAHASDASTFIHPGLSFWAERPEFPQIVASVGFFPVCPSARILSLCLNKLNVLIEAEAAGIPHLAVGLDPLSSLREVEELLANTGEKFPIVLKSLKVAQGHGIQVIDSLASLREIIPVWFEQLTRRYSEASILVERCPPSARHIVVPFASDGARFTKVFPLIDASLQTRWRRLIQFIPATDLDPIAEAAVNESVKKWVKHLDFSGFGSMEFLVDGNRVYLIDAVARLNAGFPLWDNLLGVSSVEWQLAGLGQLPVPEKEEKKFGAAVSLRFYAEDPIRQVPCPGLIREITEPYRTEAGESLAIWMTRYQANQEVKWTSSGVIGELFVFGQDRRSAITAAREEIAKIWIAGSVQTNQRFLVEHLEHPFVRENLLHAGFTDEDFIPEGFPPPDLVVAMVAQAAALFPSEGARWAAGNQWVAFDSGSAPARVAAPFRNAAGLPGFSGTFPKDEATVQFLLEPVNPDRWLAHFGVWTLPIRRVPAGAAKKAEPTRIRKILALAPGRMHALLRHPGEILQPHDRACMLESIGILVPHAVPVAVKLLEWKVAPGEIVEAGRELAVLELLG